MTSHVVWWEEEDDIRKNCCFEHRTLQSMEIISHKCGTHTHNSHANGRGSNGAEVHRAGQLHRARRLQLLHRADPGLAQLAATASQPGKSWTKHPRRSTPGWQEIP